MFNFDPYLENIIPVKDFDFNTLPSFTPSSQDDILRRLATQGKKRYYGSTSSMTGILSHFHYLLSRWRPLNTEMLPKDTPCRPSFTKITKSPAAVFLRWKNEDKTYAIDADKEYDGANVLSMMGRYMEKLLTLDKEKFELHRRSNSHLLQDKDKDGPECYHYSTIGDIVVRSQLDAYDPRLPGSGMFDLKTRAVLPIRMDSANYKWGMGYELRRQSGEWESYAREYADMIRATMLKYSLQVRMGRMDGIFVAYHNIKRIFGVQYVPINEIDVALHGQSDRVLGDQEFLASMQLLNKVLDKAVEKFPRQSIRLHFEARETLEPFMYVFAEPVTEEQVEAIQTATKERIETWEQEMLGKETSYTVSAASPEDPTESGLSAQKPDDAKEEEPTESPEPIVAQTSGPLFGMQVYVKSFVNGKPVERPTALKESDSWIMRFSLKEMTKENRVWTLYNMCKTRRKTLLNSIEDDDDTWFMKKIKTATQESIQWRKQLDKKDELAGNPIRMWDQASENRFDSPKASRDKYEVKTSRRKSKAKFTTEASSGESQIRVEAANPHNGSQQLTDGMVESRTETFSQDVAEPTEENPPEMIARLGEEQSNSEATGLAPALAKAIDESPYPSNELRAIIKGVITKFGTRNERSAKVRGQPGQQERRLLSLAITSLDLRVQLATRQRIALVKKARGPWERMGFTKQYWRSDIGEEKFLTIIPEKMKKAKLAAKGAGVVFHDSPHEPQRLESSI